MNVRREGSSNKYSVTEGSLFPSFVMFLLPLIAAGFLQQSYSLADGLILGNAINQDALGAVGSVGAILDICSLIQISLGGGCSIVVSHLYGAGRYREIDKLIKETGILVIIVSGVIVVPGIIFTDSFLSLIHTPVSLKESAAVYMRICLVGIPFISMYNMQAGILRGMGDSRHPLGGIAVTSIINIGLDLVFVVLMRKGIAGAAGATVVAEAISALYLALKIRQKRKLSTDEGGLREPEDESGGGIVKSYVAESVKVGAPQLIQSLISSGGMVLLQNITNMLGGIVVIGVVAAFKVDSVLIAPLLGIGTAVSVFTGQNTGAGNPDRVRGALRYGVMMSLLFSAVLAMFLWGLGYPLMGLFGLEADAAYYGYRYIMICLPFYWLFGMQFVLHGFLNGAKHTAVTSAASIAGLACRLLVAYLAYERLAGDVLPLAEAASWIVIAAIDTGYIIYRRLLK